MMQNRPAEQAEHNLTTFTLQGDQKIQETEGVKKRKCGSWILKFWLKNVSFYKENKTIKSGILFDLGKYALQVLAEENGARH